MKQNLWLLILGSFLFYVLYILFLKNDNEESLENLEGEAVNFLFKSEEASHVSLVGDFNDWNREKNPLFNLGNGYWSTIIRLQSGKYRYKFVVDNSQWVADPNSKEYEDDGYGGRSSIKIVKGD